MLNAKDLTTPEPEPETPKNGNGDGARLSLMSALPVIYFRLLLKVLS